MYWGLHYESMVDAVRYKIDEMGRMLDEEKRVAGELQQYVCEKVRSPRSTTIRTPAPSTSVVPLQKDDLEHVPSIVRRHLRVRASQCGGVVDSLAITPQMMDAEGVPEHICRMPTTPFTCLLYACHMPVTCLSHACHMPVTCLSHVYHVPTTCLPRTKCLPNPAPAPTSTPPGAQPFTLQSPVCSPRDVAVRDVRGRA